MGKLTEGKRLRGAIVVEEGRHMYSRFAKRVIQAFAALSRAPAPSIILHGDRVRALVSKDDRQFAAQTSEAWRSAIPHVPIGRHESD